MKPLHLTIGQESGPSHQESGRWPLALLQLHQCLAHSYESIHKQINDACFANAPGIQKEDGCRIAPSRPQ
jgi:hypothetical protein